MSPSPVPMPLTPQGQILQTPQRVVLSRYNSVSSIATSDDDNGGGALNSNNPMDNFRDWPRADDELLISTYQQIIDKPTTAPFAGPLPPSGIVQRAAKEAAKRAKSEKIPFPHSLPAIRKRLLLLCGRQAASAHRRPSVRSNSGLDAGDVFDFEIEAQQQPTNSSAQAAINGRYWGMHSPEGLEISSRRGSTDLPSSTGHTTPLRPATPGTLLRHGSGGNAEGAGSLAAAGDGYYFSTPLNQTAHGATLERSSSPLENRGAGGSNISSWLANTMTATPPPTVNGQHSFGNQRGFQGPGLLLPAVPLTPDSPSRGNLASPFKERHNESPSLQRSGLAVPTPKFGAPQRVPSPLSSGEQASASSGGMARALTSDEVINFTSQRKRDSLLKKRGMRNENN